MSISLKLEDYLEMIEHLPSELRDRFTDIREMDLSVQNRVDTLEDRQKIFFQNCGKKSTKPEDKIAEFDKIKEEYKKVIEEGNDKVQIAEECYSLVDRYLRKLDEELHKFKMELEADNRGITEILEKHSLEMDTVPQMANLKENRLLKKSKKSSIGGGFSNSYTKSSSFPMNDMLSSGIDSSGGAYGSNSSYSLHHIGAGGNAIAAAASQAIAATQQLTGRRTSSLKASFEAINMGVQTHEFSIGRELAGAAQTAIASTSFSASPDVMGGGPSAPKKKKSKSTEQVLDVVTGGLLDDTSFLEPGSSDLLGGDLKDQEWSYDPSEPRYCICNQVSYGDMVACDNDDCPYEWFHYPCVGISAPPKGKWYCPTCQTNMVRRKGRK